MSKLGVDSNSLHPTSDLLPVSTTQDVNGVMKNVKIQYLAEITAATEKTAKSGTGMLVLTSTIDHPESKERVSIDDYLSYAKSAIFRLAQLVTTIGLDEDNLDSDDFLGRMIFVTVNQQELEAKTQKDANGNPLKYKVNKIDQYIRQASPEEVEKYMASKPEIGF